MNHAVLPTSDKHGASRAVAGRQRIVIVDDDALFLKTLSLNLEDADLAVDAYTDGLVAIAAILAGPPPDALLLDWQMPALECFFIWFWM